MEQKLRSFKVTHLIVRFSGCERKPESSWTSESEKENEACLANESKEVVSKEREQGIARANDNDISFPVIMAEGYHLFPYRTQKLSGFQRRWYLVGDDLGE